MCTGRYCGDDEVATVEVDGRVDIGIGVGVEVFPEAIAPEKPPLPPINTMSRKFRSVTRLLDLQSIVERVARLIVAS